MALSFTLLLNLVTPASAVSSHGRRITGTIQMVDAQSQEVAMLREDKGIVIKFVWNKRTTFVASSQIADASILKRGARIEVIRHEPFFGKPFVTKVTLLPTYKTKKAHEK